jgi:hypothetical protein
MFKNQFFDMVSGRLTKDVVKPVIWESAGLCAEKVRQACETIRSGEIEPALGVIESRRIVMEMVRPLDVLSTALNFLANQCDPDLGISTTWKAFGTEAAEVAACVAIAYKFVDAADLNSKGSIWRFTLTKKNNFVCQPQFLSSYPRILCHDDSVGSWMLEWADSVLALAKDAGLMQGRGPSGHYICLNPIAPDTVATASCAGHAVLRCKKLLDEFKLHMFD